MEHEFIKYLIEENRKMREILRRTLIALDHNEKEEINKVVMTIEETLGWTSDTRMTEKKTFKNKKLETSYKTLDMY